MNGVLVRVERWLDQGGARRHLGAQEDVFESFPSNPMHALIRWRPLGVGHRPVLDDDVWGGWEPLDEEFGTDNCVGIVACGKTTLHPTWFLSKESVQRFMDVLSAQVKPGTTAEAFASLVAGFMQLQDEDNKANVVTIVGAVWQNGRREAAMAIAPVFLADCVPSALSPVLTEADGGWMRMLIRPPADGRLHDQFVLWHLPPDAEPYLTLAVARPQGSVPDPQTGWRTVDAASPEYVPPWSRLIPGGAPSCGLIYSTPHRVFFPRRVHHGRGVTWVEYLSFISIDDNGRDADPRDVQDATALAQLFKPDADPVVVGLGFHALNRLKFPPLWDYGFYPPASTGHHWHVVWPIEYQAHIRTDMKPFFEGLIRIAYPGSTVTCEGVGGRYEVCLWNDLDGEGVVQVGRYFECVVGAAGIKIRIANRSMADASGEDTEEDLAEEDEQDVLGDGPW